MDNSNFPPPRGSGGNVVIMCLNRHAQATGSMFLMQQCGGVFSGECSAALGCGCMGNAGWSQAVTWIATMEMRIHESASRLAAAPRTGCPSKISGFHRPDRCQLAPTLAPAHARTSLSRHRGDDIALFGYSTPFPRDSEGAGGRKQRTLWCFVRARSSDQRRQAREYVARLGRRAVRMRRSGGR